jgi:hypothetical protein
MQAIRRSAPASFDAGVIKRGEFGGKTIFR